jgi:hypothetical protein
LRLHSLFAHRPSPALVISSLALFVSLGGVGYAATQLPNGSVGPAQLKTNAVTNSKIENSAVTYKKIEPGSVGSVRANLNQLQARVLGTCTGSTGAIGSIQSNGKTTCNSTLPQEVGTTNTVAVPTALTNVASVPLPAGASYLALANPTAKVTVTGASERVSISCTLTVGANTQTRSATIPGTGASGTESDISIPLMVAGPSGTAGLTCQSSTTGTTTPSVSVTSAINAIQTSSTS